MGTNMDELPEVIPAASSFEISRREAQLQRLVIALSKTQILELCYHTVEEIVQGFFDKEAEVAKEAEFRVAQDIANLQKRRRLIQELDFFTTTEGEQDEVHKQS